jgi:uncharacterized protein (UPF0147 family)
VENVELIELLQGIIEDRGVPRNIKSSLEESICILNGECSKEEKIAHIVSILDDASSNPNLSMHTRTNIWNIVSFLESIKK